MAYSLLFRMLQTKSRFSGICWIVDEQFFMSSSTCHFLYYLSFSHPFGFPLPTACHCHLICLTGRIPGAFQRLAEWTSKCQPETFQLWIYCNICTLNTLYQSSMSCFWNQIQIEMKSTLKQIKWNLWIKVS